MAEYIEREALLKKSIEEKRFVFSMEDLIRDEVVVRTVYKDLAEFIWSIPTADVVEVKHGRWVQVICHEEFEDGFVDRVKECCSVCHAPNWRRTSNYCPNCGARMDGE